MRCISDDFVEGSIFHIYNHAIDNYDLFYDDEDYDYFLNIFKNNLSKVPASIYAYCLMPNHYHFLIRQDSDIQVYRLFNYSFIRFAIYFNKKYNRKGPIFRSPLQHKIIDNNIYLLQLCKYIHMNPVRKDLVSKPENWIYSDYNDWINKTNNIFLSEHSRQKICEDVNLYKRFINSYTNFLDRQEFKKFTFRRY